MTLSLTIHDAESWKVAVLEMVIVVVVVILLNTREDVPLRVAAEDTVKLGRWEWLNWMEEPPAWVPSNFNVIFTFEAWTLHPDAEVEISNGPGRTASSPPRSSRSTACSTSFNVSPKRRG